MSAASNPFDFSDFGRRASSGTNGRDGTHGRDNRQQGQRLAGGFDPFGTESRATQQNPAGDEVFTASAAPARPSAEAVAGPPLQLVAAALGAAVAGIALAAVAAATETTVALAFAGWLLAGPAAIGVLAWFTHVDTRRRISSVYSAPTWLTTAYWSVVVICAAGIGFGAWQIALWAGRQ
jgi:hypothetical protein